METYAGMRRKVGELRELLERGDPFVLTFGSAHAAELYCLPASVICFPAEGWDAVVKAVYHPGVRITVDHRSLSEAVVVRILTNQVDADLKPYTYGFLEVKGTPGAYLVPRSPWWRARVEGE